MKHRRSLLLSFTLLLQVLTPLFDAPDMFACTAFLVKDGKHVLFGNNEDYLNPATIMWFMPKGGDAYGRVYFGYDDLSPQGGMNEAGLVMDGFATAQIPVKKRLNGITLSMPNLVNKAMATCATVQEVIDLFNRYNMKELENFMLMFGDRSGDAVIFEGDEIVQKSGPHQLVTNFHLSSDLKGENPVGPEKTWGADMRFKIATGMLQDTRDFTVKRARDILAAVYTDGPQYMTLYSNVYDLNTRRIYLYHLHDFQNAVVVDLARELAKGRH